MRSRRGTHPGKRLYTVKQLPFLQVGFNPTNIAGLQLWLDGSDISTLFTDSAKTTPVTSDGDVVGAWADKSGNGKDATQATTANKPLYKTSIQNGLSIVRFDSSNDYLQTSLTAPQSAVSIFVISRLKTTPAAAGDVVIGWRDSNDDGYGNVYLNTDKMRFHVDSDDIFSDAENKTSFYLYSSLWSGTHSYIYQNGTLKDDVAATLAGTTVNLYIGVSAYALASPFDGDIAEIIVYDKEVSATNRAAVEKYLNNKWSIY